MPKTALDRSLNDDGTDVVNSRSTDWWQLYFTSLLRTDRQQRFTPSCFNNIGAVGRRDLLLAVVEWVGEHLDLLLGWLIADPAP